MEFCHIEALCFNCSGDISVIGDIVNEINIICKSLNPLRREANCWANALTFEANNIVDESFGWTLHAKLPTLQENSYD
ncbi:hypothetical protein CsSME_00011006 [Camellia sinensis var. sinensis]